METILLLGIFNAEPNKLSTYYSGCKALWETPGRETTWVRMSPASSSELHQLEKILTKEQTCNG